jgi:RNA polymerase sigma-70 factor (ECF subfamily)
VEQLLATYGAALLRLTAGYADHPADREDLFQDIQMALWRALPRFRGDSSERTWVYRIAHNVAITNSIRRKRRREDALVERWDHRGTPETEYADTERRRLLVQAVQQLEGSDKQIVLSYLEGLPSHEIAEIVGLTGGAVNTRLSRLRTRLAELVKQGVPHERT